MGKSSSAPPAPDYAGAAEATAAGNLEAAKYAAEANRVNQITPYGTLTYNKETIPGEFDQAGYDAALANYNKQIQGAGAAGGGLGKFGRMAAQAQALRAPDRNSFMRDRDVWTATQNLSPAQQAQLEANERLNLQLSGVAQKGLNNAEDLLSDPTVDFSGLPQAISGESAQAEIMKRLQPQLDRQREANRTQLLNQGINIGNQAYSASMDDQARRENDLYSAAAIQGIGVDERARQQGIQERTYAKDRPLNLINALRTGTQVQNPQFVNPAQQGQTGGADIMGATNALSGYNTDLYNADVSQNNATMSGIAGLAMAGATAY